MTCYEICSLIISAIAAIATFCAVFVALFQTKLQYRKKLAIVYNNNISFDETTQKPKYIELIIFNTSNAKLTISNVYLHKQYYFALVGNVRTPLFQKPKVLDIGESFSFLIPYKEIIFVIQKITNKNKKILNKRIRFVVEDITNKKFKYTVNHTYNDYLLWENGKKELLPIIN